MLAVLGNFALFCLFALTSVFTYLKKIQIFVGSSYFGQRALLRKELQYNRPLIF